MRIAIEVTFAAEEKKTGLSVYTEKLLAALAEQADPDDIFYLLHAQKNWFGRNYGKNFIPVSYACSNSQLFSICFSLNKTLKKLNVDLFHVLCNSGAPPVCSVPVLTTVHDLFFLTGKDIPFKTKLILKMMFRWTLWNTQHFISNSETTKNSLCEFGIPGKKITTIYPGVENFVYPEPKAVSKPYFLCVGALEHRKGQTMLAEAYLKALQKKPDLPDLIFIGPRRGDCQKLLKIIETVPKIQWLDYISEKELAEYYANAKAFLYPSYQEGFGLPLIEAMSAGIPVICSDIPIFREIADGCAVFVKPEPHSFSEALEHFENMEFKIEKSYQRAKTFTWKNAAEKLLSIYKERCTSTVDLKNRSR